jgi:hypothetical protein
VQTSGLDDLHTELHAKSYRYMNPGIETKEWGTREMCVVDPSNNRIYFSEAIA